MKRYSASLISGKIQIKTILRYYLTPVRMTVIKKQKASVRVWIYCNHCTPLVRMQNGVMTMENGIVVLKKKLKIELPYDLAISLWGIYLKETLTWKPNVHCSNICSVARLCLTLCNPIDCSTPGSSVLHYLPEFAQIHVHWTGDAI